jgi:tRNA pseudouridine55 synthase
VIRAEAADGVLVLDKPEGPTSHDMVDLVRRVLRTRRVGHTGTLDPMATGVLPVCVGQATRLAQFLAESDKAYRAVARLGFATSTDDALGEPVGQRSDCEASSEELRQVVLAFVGDFDQVPPAFSAKRTEGVRAYERARAGMAVRLAPSRVSVRHIALTSHEAGLFSFDVICSAGTYVRSLARDIGARLGVGAHLVALRRTASGGFGVEESVTPARLAEAGASVVIPLSRLLLSWPSVRVPEALLGWVANGRVLPLDALPMLEGGAGDRIRLLNADGALVGLAHRTGVAAADLQLPRPEGLHPFVVFAPPGS